MGFLDNDGSPASQARFYGPNVAAVAPDGGMLLGTMFNYRVRRVGSDGIIDTVAGTGTYYGTGGYYGDGGLATQARLYAAKDIGFMPDGSTLITDSDAGIYVTARVRRIGLDGIITTFAGGGTDSGDGVPAAQARLALSTYGLAVGPDSIVFISDADNERIRKISPSNPRFGISDFTIASEDSRQLYRFSASGRHLSTIDTLTKAVVYSFAYDSAGRLTAVTDTDGNTLTIERDASGHPTAIVAPFGQRTALSLDANGYLARVADPAGNAYAMTYTADGLLTAFADPNGQTSTLAYNSLGQLIGDTEAAGGGKTLERAKLASGDGYSVTLTSGEGRATLYQVRNLGTGDQERRVTGPDGATTVTLTQTNGTIKTTAPDGTVTETVEGPDPRFGMQSPIAKSTKIVSGGKTATLATSVSAALSDPLDPLSLTTLTTATTVNTRNTTSVYTAATRRSETTSPAGRKRYSLLDAQGHLIETGVTGLAPLALTYDAQGRPTTLTQTSGGETRQIQLAYDAQGQLDTLTDPLGRTVEFSHDLAGRLVGQTLPDLSQIGFDYDPKGNLTALTPPGQPAHAFDYTPVDLAAVYQPPSATPGGDTGYAYDLDRQPTRVLRPDGDSIEASYDSAGRLDTLTTPAGSYGYGYNAASQLISLTAPGDIDLSYSYSQALLTGVTWTGPVAGQVGFVYDNDFRLSQVTVNGANSIAYAYDTDSLLIAAGALTLSRRADNGLLSGTRLGLVSDSYTYNGFGERAGYEATVDGTEQFAAVYTRDRLGQIVKKTETVASVTTTDTYAYDARGRLIEVQRNDVITDAYTYDANGNRLSKTASGSSVTGTYDDQDRLLAYGGATYAYTANGELQTKTVGAAVTAYDYDARGNLRGVDLPNGKQIEYLIDGQNRRIGKQVNGTLVQGFLYQESLKPIAELDGTGDIVSRFVYASGVNVPDYLIKDGATYRLIKDHLGSLRLVVDATTGAVAQRIDYDAFGNVLADTNPGFQPFGFAGGLYDQDTGLVRFAARDYDPETGRWTAKDVIGFSDTANRYAYAKNDPINLQDLNGLFTIGLNFYNGFGGGASLSLDDNGASLDIEFGLGKGMGIEFDPKGTSFRGDPLRYVEDEAEWFAEIEGKKSGVGLSCSAKVPISGDDGSIGAPIFDGKVCAGPLCGGSGGITGKWDPSQSTAENLGRSKDGGWANASVEGKVGARYRAKLW
ncbi:hypothetical protein CCR95_14600 [Thiocystis minor]|nr:hypothetical protein [Thiocystis minor]